MTQTPDDVNKAFQDALKRSGVGDQPSKGYHRPRPLEGPADVSSYEQAVLKHIAGKLENAPAMSFLRRAHHDETDSTIVSLAWFCERYPDFPFYLGAGKFRSLHKVQVADLFKRFTKLPFVEGHERLREAQPQDDARPCALVFEWAGWSRFVVLHTAFRSDDVNATMLVRPISRRGEEPFVLETLETCLKANPWERTAGDAAD